MIFLNGGKNPQYQFLPVKKKATTVKSPVTEYIKHIHIYILD